MSHIYRDVFQRRNFFFLIYACVSNVSFKLRFVATVINDGKCLYVSPGLSKLLFLFVSENNCSHKYVPPNITHILQANFMVLEIYWHVSKYKTWYSKVTGFLLQNWVTLELCQYALCIFVRSIKCKIIRCTQHENFISLNLHHWNRF